MQLRTKRQIKDRVLATRHNFWANFVWSADWLLRIYFFEGESLFCLRLKRQIFRIFQPSCKSSSWCFFFYIYGYQSYYNQQSPLDLVYCSHRRNWQSLHCKPESLCFCLQRKSWACTRRMHRSMVIQGHHTLSLVCKPEWAFCRQGHCHYCHKILAG